MMIFATAWEKHLHARLHRLYVAEHDANACAGELLLHLPKSRWLSALIDELAD